MRPLLASVLALGLLFGAIAPARADDDSAAQARAHYQKANSYYDLGRFQDAIVEYEAAYELKNNPAFLYNLAQSHRKAGNAEQALRFYKTYLRKAPKGPFRAETEAFIAQLEQLVTQKNASQTSPPSSTLPPSGSTTPPAALEPPLPAPPAALEPPPPAGAPPVGAAPPSPPSPSAVEPTTPPETPPSQGPPVVAGLPPRAPPSNHRRLIRAGEITAGVGVVLFIVGAAYGAAAVGAANEVNDEAKNGQPFNPSVQSSGQKDQGREAFFMTLGVLAGGTGAVLFFYGRHLEAQERAMLMPMASNRGGGLSLRVTF